jgi:protein-tyrosine-phosphatase
MAAALLRAALPPEWEGEVTVSSAGTHAWNGSPAASLSVVAMGEKGFDIRSHKARLVTPDIINKASLIVALADEHMLDMNAAAPGAGEWMVLLGGLDPDRENTDVDDPIGGSLDDYRAARDDMAHLIRLLLVYIADRLDLPPTSV